MHKSFGEQIQKERETQNLTIETFAKACDTTPSDITFIETGKRLPEKAILPKIAEVLHVPTKVVLQWYFSDIKEKILNKERLY